MLKFYVYSFQAFLGKESGDREKLFRGLVAIIGVLSKSYSKTKDF